jgi:hypothetical protein
MGYAPAHATPLALFVICGAVVWAIWCVPASRRTTERSPS